jgi:hypothetical protein
MRKRYLTFGAAAVAVTAAVAACGGPMSAGEGRTAADKARRPAAETYWKLYHSLDGAVVQGDGKGEFPACAKKKNSVSYKITYTFFAMSANEPQAQLTAAVKTRLGGTGWNLQPSEDHVSTAVKNGITVRLREIVVGGPGPQADTLYVESACTDVGSARAAVSRTSDAYSAGDAASSPIPSAFSTPAQ